MGINLLLFLVEKRNTQYFLKLLFNQFPNLTNSSMAECWYISKNAKNTCTKISPSDGCKVKIDYCAQDSKQYHKLCDRIWDLQEADLEKMSIQEIDRLIDDADVCIYMRKRAQETCIDPNCRDAGHIGAMKRIQNKLRILKHEKHARVIEERYQRWFLNPEDESIWDDEKSDLPTELTKLRFPPIQDVTWQEFLIETGELNDMKIKIHQWPASDPLFPRKWSAGAIFTSGEEYISTGNTEEEACQELMSDLVNVFATDPVYRKNYWKSFKPIGWYDYKTNTRVKGVFEKASAKKRSKRK